MFASAAARARFVDHSLDTASPSRLLTLLYDRLLLDVARAERALRDGNRQGAHTLLLHAQDIVSALRDGLDTSWDGAARLDSIYTFLLTELVSANVDGDADRAAACLELIAPLRDTWHEAAVVAGAGAATAAFVGQSA